MQSITVNCSRLVYGFIAMLAEWEERKNQSRLYCDAS